MEQLTHLEVNTSDGPMVVLNEKQFASVVSDVITRTCIRNVNYPGHPFSMYKTLQTYPKHEYRPIRKYSVTWEYVLTGSSAEFYIRPIVPCINDVDVMISRGDTLIVDDDNPHFPPIGDINDEIVKVFKLKYLNKFPAYVRLYEIGEFFYDWESEVYGFDVWRPEIIYRPDNDMMEKTPYICKPVGPAVNYRMRDPLRLPVGTPLLEILPECDHFTTQDSVQCYRCHFWPKVASEWKHRLREYGWPSKSMIRNIVANGCDVVRVSHPNIKEDKTVHRLSFSRAEVMLIRSWSHVQQVVFHMLRYFAKAELIKPNWDDKNKILCTYHIKTLMLWACETEKDFWDGNIADICCILLKRLKVSLKEEFLPNYFIQQCNLYDHFQNEANRQEVIQTLEAFKVPHLIGLWFNDHYIMKSKILTLCMEMYTKHRSLFEEMNEMFYRTIVKRDCESLLDGVYNRQAHESPVYNRKKTLEDAGNWFTEYITATQMLYFVKGLKCHIFPDDKVEIFGRIATLYKQFEVHSLPAAYKQRLPESRLYFITAQELMTGLSVEMTPGDFYLITELSIECFQKCIRMGESTNDLQFCRASMVYVAALHLIRGEISVVVHLCSKLLNENHKVRNRKYTVAESAEERRQIAIVGFLILYRNIRICRITSAQANITKRMIEHKIFEKHITNKYIKPETVNGRLLLFIDDVPSTLGYLALYRYVESSNTVRLSQTPLPNWTNFTPMVIARHLLSLCRSENNQTTLNSFEMTLTVPDQCLMRLSELKRNLLLRKKRVEEEEGNLDPKTTEESSLNQCEHSSISEYNFIQLLMDVYFEKLTIAFNMLRIDLMTDCVADVLLRALYSFRCHEYDLVLSLCDQLDQIIIVERDQHLHCKICFLAFTSSTDPPVDVFLDDDIRIVFGLDKLLQTINGCEEKDYYYLCKGLSYGDEEKVSDSSSKLELLGRNFFHKMTRAFLAKYLRIRCLMETKRPIREIIVVYESLNETLKNGSFYDQAVFVLVHSRLRLQLNPAE